LDRWCRESLRPALHASESLEREHDQRIAGQHGQRFAECLVHRRPPAAHIRRVEAGQIVMHQRGAMQQLERGTRCLRRSRMILAAGGGNAVNQPRPYPGAPRKHRVAHRGSQPWRASRHLGQRNGFVEGPLDPTGDIHDRLPKTDCQFHLSS